MKFTLNIEIGKATMCRYRHLAEALEGIARRIRMNEIGGPEALIETQDRGPILDVSGNTCGKWSLR